MGGLVLKAVSKNKDEVVTTQAKSLFEFDAKLINGQNANLGDVCKGKKCTIVVNVAQN